MRRLLLLLCLAPLVARADEIPDREPGMVVHAGAGLGTGFSGPFTWLVGSIEMGAGYRPFSW